MKTHIEKCIGGLAVVVPETMAVEAGLKEGTPVDLELTAGRLELRPRNPVALEDLMAQVTPENLHGEWAKGPPIGSEIL